MYKFPGPGPGRPLGSRSRLSIKFSELLESENFEPARELIACYREAKKTYDNYGAIYAAIVDARILKNDKDGSCATPTEDKAHQYLKIAADIAKELASYAYPKLKSVEQVKVSATSNMTPSEKLEALKSMMQIVQKEVDEQSGNT